MLELTSVNLGFDGDLKRSYPSYSYVGKPFEDTPFLLGLLDQVVEIASVQIAAGLFTPHNVEVFTAAASVIRYMLVNGINDWERFALDHDAELKAIYLAWKTDCIQCFGDLLVTDYPDSFRPVCEFFEACRAASKGDVNFWMGELGFGRSR